MVVIREMQCVTITGHASCRSSKQNATAPMVFWDPLVICVRIMATVTVITSMDAPVKLGTLSTLIFSVILEPANKVM